MIELYYPLVKCMNGYVLNDGKGYTMCRFDKHWLEERVEPLARMLAAEKMGLTKDRYGENQCYELWSQCIPEAKRMLGLEQ